MDVRGSHLMSRIIYFFTDESAATAIEYGLIIAGIAIAIIAAVNGIGTQLNTTLASISTKMN